MDDKLLEIVNQYKISVRNTYRGRGATICVTDKGIKIVKEFHGSAGKLMDEYKLKEGLMANGFPYVDQYVKNKEDGFFSLDRYQVTYIVKDYFEGKECDIRNVTDVLNAGENLARFHETANKIEISQRTKDTYQSCVQMLYKRNQELKRVRMYLKTVQRKGEFELIYINHFEEFWKQANDAFLQLQHLESKGNGDRIGICHGEYNQHNLLKIDKSSLATINFEHFYYNNQLLDLYQFLRKTLEKNHYSMDYAKALMKGYDSVISLQSKDYVFLYIMLAYPEKIWKISNHYFNSKKCWIPPKTIEKLNDTIGQSDKKYQFLEIFKKDFIDSKDWCFIF